MILCMQKSLRVPSSDLGKKVRVRNLMFRFTDTPNPDLRLGSGSMIWMNWTPNIRFGFGFEPDHGQSILHRSPAFPWHSRLFPTISVCSMTISIRSVSLHFSDCSVIRPFRVFRLFPSISLFRLVSFQFSILGSNRSESESLLSIRLHFCSATIPFPVDLRVLLSFDLMTSVSPSNYDPLLIVLFCI